MVIAGLRQRRQRRGRPQRVGQREQDHQRDPRRHRPRTCAMLDELGGPKTYNHYPNGWAMAFNTPFKMWKRYEFNGGTSDPCIISWPKGIKAQGEIREQYHHADRPGPDDPRRARRRAPGDDRRARAEPLRRRQHALQLRRRAAAQRARDPVLLDARLAQHLAPGLEGRHQPPDDQRLGQLRQGHVGALRHRCRPLRAARPRRRPSPSACSELVNLWYAEAGANGAFPLDDRSALEIITHAAAAALAGAQPLRLLPGRRRRPRVPGGQHPRTAPTPSALSSTSPVPAPKGCSSRTARASAATPST